MLELFFNQEGAIDIKKYSKTTRVKDFLDANREFLEENPLACFECTENCCRQGWDIELDIVFVNRLLENRQLKIHQLFEEYIGLSKLKNPIFKDQTCKFLHKEGFCMIYDQRPFICRAYTCHLEGDKYRLLRGIILRFLNLTLLFKVISLKEDSSPLQVADRYSVSFPREIPLHKKNYKIVIHPQVNNFREFLSSSEQDLYQTLL